MQMIGSAGEPLRLTSDPRNDYNPVWSPDGLSIAFLRLQPEGSRSDLRLVPPLGGPERKLAEIRVGEAIVTAPYLAWLPDGSGLVVTDAPGDGQPLALFHVLLATGEKRPLTRPGPKAAGDAHPAVSPDGRSLVFRRNASALFAGELYQLALRSDWTAAQEPRRLTPVALDAEHPAFTPDSKEIVFSARGGLWRLEVDGGAPGMRAPTRLPFVGEDGRMPQVARAQAGRPSRLVYVRSFFDFYVDRPAGEQGLYSVDPESSQTRLRYFDFTTGRAHTVAPDLGSVDLPLAVGRGGRTILYGRMDASVVDLMLVEGFR